MQITTHAKVTIPLPRQAVFNYAVDSENLKKDLAPYGPIAGIVDGVMLDGQPLEQGARRRMTLTDGTVLDEDILAFDPPNEHQYRWSSGLKPPFAWLVRAGEGRWLFTDVEGGTQVDWHYTFDLRSPLAYPFTLAITGLFRRWQLQGLNSIRRSLAQQPVTSVAHA